MNDRKITIYLRDPEEVSEFVHLAEQCEFDVDIYYNRVIIDAKSLLGILSMDLSRPLNVRLHGEDAHFEKAIARFAA